jgi:hypothetical protein
MVLLADLKERACREVDRLADELSRLGQDIHAHPELGFGEHQACAWLTTFLDKQGCEIERGAAGLRTAFRATLAGAGPGPTVGFVLEYDASPEVDHGCGHNLIGPAHAGAAAALRALTSDWPGRVVLLGTPSGEEGGGGLKIMLALGEFRGMDAVFRFHPQSFTFVDSRPLGSRALGELFRANLNAHGLVEDEAPPALAGRHLPIDRLTWVAPTLAPYVAICPRSVGRDDTPRFAAAADTPLAYGRMLVAAKVLAMTTLDVLLQPAAREGVKREFETGKWLRYRNIMSS